jgi:beta-glucanase (GH16 family)
MIKATSFISGLFLLAGLGATPATAIEERVEDHAQNRLAIFDCEFDTPSDLDKWTIQDESGTNYNHELQAYVPDAFHIRDGCLFIEAQKRDARYDGGKTLMHYTSGMLTTRHKFDIQYGQFDIRFKVPKGKGFWPAFWLLPSSGEWPPEIDFLEILGDQPKVAYLTNHYGIDKGGKHQQHGPVKCEREPDYSQDFHVLSGIWDEHKIVWYMDGKKVSESSDGVPHEKMYMLLNLAVGGDWPGSPDSDTLFPSSMVVDYVRVYDIEKPPNH